MKVELHLHTSRYSGCASNTPQELMRRLVETGYEAVCITEHDAVWTDEELAQLRGAFPEIAIFPGVELTVGFKEFSHLLVLGTNDPWCMVIRDGQEVIRWARARGHPTIIAHPFRWEFGHELLEGPVLPDAIEYFTCNQGDEAAAKAEEAARRLGVALVNGGDVHSLGMVDRFWIETNRPIAKADEIRAVLLEGAYENRSRPVGAGPAAHPEENIWNF
jgi:hypothetical protein